MGGLEKSGGGLAVVTTSFDVSQRLYKSNFRAVGDGLRAFHLV
jgi:hypothetical protein